MKTRDIVLAAVAVVSVLFYALACKPAWHPSGKTIAFPMANDNASGIALYDCDTGGIRTLIADGKDTLANSQCLWTPDGKSLLVVAPGGDDSICVARLDPADPKPDVIKVIQGLDTPLPVLPPFLVNERYLWFGPFKRKETEEMFNARLDLKDGSADEFINSTESAVSLYDFGKRGYYYGEFLRDSAAADRKNVMLGTFDPLTGERKPLGSVRAAGDVEIVYLAAEPEGERFAIVAVDAEKPSLQVLDGKMRPTRSIPLPADLQNAAYIEWIGGTVWMAAASEIKTADASESHVGLLAIDVESGNSQFLALGPSANGTKALFYLQPSLSPDGKTLAVSGLGLEPKEGGVPIALVLIDPAAPEKAPKVVPLPAGALPEGAPEVESTAPSAVESTGAAPAGQ